MGSFEPGGAGSHGMKVMWKDEAPCAGARVRDGGKHEGEDINGDRGEDFSGKEEVLIGNGDATGYGSCEETSGEYHESVPKILTLASFLSDDGIEECVFVKDRIGGSISALKMEGDERHASNSTSASAQDGDGGGRTTEGIVSTRMRSSTPWIGDKVPNQPLCGEETCFSSSVSSTSKPSKAGTTTASTSRDQSILKLPSQINTSGPSVTGGGEDGIGQEDIGCENVENTEEEGELERCEESEQMCCVCLDQAVDRTAVLPCGHVCMCRKCTELLAFQPKRNKCPFCRAPYLKRRNSLESMPDPQSTYAKLRLEFMAERQDEGPARCPCGEIMNKIESIQAHQGYPVECDICKRVIRGYTMVYHCDMVEHPTHPFGFDVCVPCATNSNQVRGCFGRRRRSL